MDCRCDGYHLTINRANNPLQDTKQCKNKLIPIYFKLKNAKVADINRKAQNLTVTRSIRKHWTSYQNTAVLPYTLCSKQISQSLLLNLDTIISLIRDDSFLWWNRIPFLMFDFHQLLRLKDYLSMTTRSPIKIQDSRVLSRKSMRLRIVIEWIFSSPDASVEVY